MAVNKVNFGNTTIMDITDTTVTTNDVIEGKVFYSNSGVRSVGTLTDATQSTHGLMSTSDKIKLDGISTMVGATSSVNGGSGLVPTPTTSDVNKFLAGDGTYKSGGLPMVILSYGNSTWTDFINAYNNNVIVYCRASSNANPAAGTQGRLAFMAYLNNSTNPTNVEFQYYRSVSSHSTSQLCDQVFIYKLDKTSGWSVTMRQAGIQQFAVSSNSNLSYTYSDNKITLTGGLPRITSNDNGKILKVVGGKWTTGNYIEEAVTQATKTRVSLYTGTATPDNTTSYTISSTYTAYHWILIECMANTDSTYQLINSDDITTNGSNEISFYSASADIVGKIESFPSQASCKIYFTDATHFKVKGFWTDDNYIMSVTNIWGINPK